MWTVGVTLPIADHFHRYQDAEKDSSSTLEIQKNNVKALFRRGQARMHLENLDESQDGGTSSTMTFLFS